MGPTDLSDALKALHPSQDSNLLVGFETCDDAAVYRLSDEIAFISTVDFITPPVDDPYWFGQIAAANALSDVYAMGGKPLTALNLVMFPTKKLESSILREMLRGGCDKVSEAGASIAGGHSVDDNEPKYGLAVTGVIHPDRILTNCGAKEGDALILTKPLGTGVLFNACRSKKLSLRDLEVILPEVASLNKKAIEIALNFDVHACTDITGFGIVGHCVEIAKGSRVQVNLFYEKLPFYPNALLMYRRGETTGSNKANQKLAEGFFKKIRVLSREEEELLFDPQTSGGLLLSLSSTEVDRLVTELKRAGIEAAAPVGEVTANPEPSVRVL
ncbi:MAG TPA: selenide, water dikinase SelD [Thermodesulfobacteriota bacterium]|nr:selenide, water dikinase SelD [Thermodesulfobacteriota bacterium]